MMRNGLPFSNFMTGERRKMYLFLLALIYIAFISLGLPDSLLGSGWPVMHAEFGVPVSYMGIISMIISGGTVVSSLFSDKMTRKFGTRIVTVASVFLTVIALFGFSFSSQFWMLAVFAVPYGLICGIIGIIGSVILITVFVVNILLSSDFQNEMKEFNTHYDTYIDENDDSI